MTVTLLKYLERVLTEAVDDCPEVVGNLWKLCNSWAWMVGILGREGASPWVSGMFFKAVVQARLLYSGQICV